MPYMFIALFLAIMEKYEEHPEMFYVNSENS